MYSNTVDVMTEVATSGSFQTAPYTSKCTNNNRTTSLLSGHLVSFLSVARSAEEMTTGIDGGTTHSP